MSLAINPAMLAAFQLLRPGLVGGQEWLVRRIIGRNAREREAFDRAADGLPPRHIPVLPPAPVRVTLSVVKQSGAKMPPPRSLALIPVRIGDDARGQPVYSQTFIEAPR